MILETQDAPPYTNQAGPITDEQPRCWRCRRVLANKATRPWEIKCGRCNAVTASAPAYGEAK